MLRKRPRRAVLPLDALDALAGLRVALWVTPVEQPQMLRCSCRLVRPRVLEVVERGSHVNDVGDVQRLQTERTCQRAHDWHLLAQSREREALVFAINLYPG
eukprot:11201947-Lingulodinium_polyedra.AAC.1